MSRPLLLHHGWGRLEIVRSRRRPIDQQATTDAKTATHASQHRQLIGSPQQMLNGRQPDDGEIKLFSEREASHVASDHAHTGIAHRALTDPQHRVGGVNGCDLEATPRERSRDATAACAELDNSLTRLEQLQQHLDIVRKRAEIELVPRRDHAQSSFLIVGRPVEWVVHAASARPLHRSQSAYQRQPTLIRASFAKSRSPPACACTLTP